MRNRRTKRLPAWHTEWLQRCATFAEKDDFPQKELAQRFSTGDANGRLPPAQELAEFVLIHFGDGGAADGRALLIPGAEKMLREAIKRHGPILSAWDLARLHAVHALLLRATAAVSANRIDALKAVAAFRRAIAILQSAQLSTRLSRHLAWLAADTIINLAEARINADLLVEMLVLATRGEPRTATGGLYFGCLSRSFLLQEQDFQKYSQAVREDLYRAWASLPAARDVPSMKEPASIQHRTPLGAHPDFAQLKALFDEQSNPSPEEVPHIGESLSGDLLWEPADRCAVSAFLARIDAGAEQAQAYAYEARVLKQKLSKHTEEVRRSAALLEFIETLPATKPVAPEFSFEALAHPEAKAALSDGRIAESIRHLARQVETEKDPLLAAYLRMQRARLIGESRSAAEEWEELAAINDELAPRDDWSALIVRGYSQLHLAMNRWNVQRDEEALRHVEEAKYLAGRAGDPQLALRVSSLEFRIRDSLGAGLNEHRYNGHVRATANIWNHNDFFYYLTRGATLDFGEHFDEQANIRQLRGEVYHLRVSDRSSSEIEAMLDRILSIEPGEDKLAWCSVLYRFWRKLQRPARNLSASFIAEMQIRTAKELLRVFFEFLPVVRGRRLQSDIAELLGQWLVKHHEEAEPELRDQIGRALCTAAENERRRIAALTQRKFLPGPRTRLRNLLAALARAGMLSSPEATQISVLVDACKAIDGDERNIAPKGSGPAQLFAQPDLDFREDFPKGEAEVEQTANVGAPSGHIAVLNFFIAGLNVRGGEQDASFVILSKDGQEETFPLPGAIAGLKEFRKLVIDLGGSPSGGWKTGLAKSLDSLRTNCKSELHAPEIAKFWASATILGGLLFPETVKRALTDTEHVVLVPDGHLFALPLHLLPMTDGSLLIDTHAISYRPKQSYGRDLPAGPSPAGKLVCINTEDENMAAVADSVLELAAQSENVFEARVNPQELVDRLATAQIGIFLLHGHTCFTSRMLHRIALRDGARLTALDVLLSKASLAATKIFLMACHSADPHIENAREMLGLASAFLQRNARAVLASLWKCEIADAYDLLRGLLAPHEDEEAVPRRYRSLLLEASTRLTRPEFFLRYGPFILYGHW